jgi:hypothetical protein
MLLTWPDTAEASGGAGCCGDRSPRWVIVCKLLGSGSVPESQVRGNIFRDRGMGW